MTEKGGIRDDCGGLLNPFAQSSYQIRFEWGAEGVEQLAPSSRVVVIIDVLSFTTCVDVTVSRDARVFPYRYKDDSAQVYAETVGAVLAGQRGELLSLSPTSLRTLGSGARIVLPSPNGSTCTVVAAKNDVHTVAASLRNASAVAEYIQSHFEGEAVTVIACGEHWPSGMLRPALEDFVGAGAVLACFDEGLLSPEARIAAQTFQHCQNKLAEMVADCSSGRELLERGFASDVFLASELNASRTVPLLRDGAYVDVSRRSGGGQDGHP